jgi:uncharacterized membrane protein
MARRQPVEIEQKSPGKPAVSAPVTKVAGISTRLDWVFIGLTLVGIGISSYLTWAHFTNTSIICTADRSCDTVNHSSWAYFPPNWGIPVSILGLIGYFVLGGLGVLRLRLAQRPAEEVWKRLGQLDMALFVGTLGGVIFSGYLTAMELWVIDAICWWCVASAITMTILFIISVVRIWNTI